MRPPRSREITLYLCTGCRVVYGTAKRVGLIHTARCSRCGEMRAMHAIVVEGAGFREVRGDDARNDTMQDADFSTKEGGST